MSKPIRGTQATQSFYDQVGWTMEGGATVDAKLFGVRFDGKLRQSIHRRMLLRIENALRSAKSRGSVLEVGCGGHPAEYVADAFASYTGVDFSSRGIQVASQEFVKKGYNSQFQVADACDLQFPPGSFDAVFSAHMLYHIENSEAQRKALSEMVRVLRPGGVVVLVLANPRPILFPLRLGIRLVAERPLLRRMAAKLRGPSLLPYNPQTIRWTRSALTDLDDVTVVTANLASTAFNQNVSETSFFGSRIWRFFDWLSRDHPRAAAHLGNYVIVSGRKS